MLILTRKKGESLIIGDDINVTVLGIRGNQVRIGVDAPRDVAVHRQEIYDRIREEKGGQSTSPNHDEPASSSYEDAYD